jgi:hypothetical protein
MITFRAFRSIDTHQALPGSGIAITLQQRAAGTMTAASVA